MTAGPTRERWVDDAKGLACFLVAAGHGLQGLVSAGILDAGNLWRWFNGAIYCFHVQLFFLCSGYLWQRFGRSRGWRGHGRAALEKIWVLGVPYVVFTALQWLLKTACAPWVNHPAGDLFRNLFIKPVAPYWYLAALAVLFALLPRAHGKRMWAWMFFGAAALKAAAAAAGSGGWCFAARTVSGNAFWFAGGMGLALRRADCLVGRAAKWAGAACGTVFAAGSAVAFWPGFSGNAWLKWGLGVAACAAALAWAANRGEPGAGDFWNWAGRNALPIFLMHTFCAAAVRMGLCAAGVETPWVHVPAMLAASMAGPAILSAGLERWRLDGLLDPRRWSRHGGGTSGKSKSPVLAAACASTAVETLCFYGDTWWRRMALRAVSVAGYGLKWCSHAARGGMKAKPNADRALAEGDWQALCACFTRKSPKEVFLSNYKRIQRREKRHGRRKDNPETA